MTVTSPPAACADPRDGRDRGARGRFEQGNKIGPRFGEGNAARLVHGLKSKQYKARLLEAARVPMREHAQAIGTDLGDDVSRLKADLVGRYVELHVLADSLAAHVFSTGPLSAKGKTRASTLLLLSVTDRLMKLATAIGLERRTKAVDLARYLSTPQDTRMVMDDANHAGAIDRASSDAPEATATNGGTS